MSYYPNLVQFQVESRSVELSVRGSELKRGAGRCSAGPEQGNSIYLADLPAGGLKP